MSAAAERIEEARRAYVAALGTDRELAAKRYLEAQVEQARKARRS